MKQNKEQYIYLFIKQMGLISSSSQSLLNNGQGQVQQEKKLRIFHQRFTNCEIDLQKQQITTRIKVDFSMFEYQYWTKHLELLQLNPSSNMLYLPKSYQLEHPMITCGTGDNLKLTFDNYPFILQQQIRNRSINTPPNYLQQQQLWMLLYTLLKSQQAFANLSLKVGDIHPHNIFINSDGYPRLACQFSWPNEKTNFQKMYYDKIPRYISPQQMRLCEQGQHPDICYSNTSQAFSIGLTMLSTGILQNLDRICDMRTYRFNRRYLQTSIRKWMGLRFRDVQSQQIVSYSEQIKDIVRNLCNQDINERYSVSRVYDVLKLYEEKIINVERFKIQNYWELIKKGKGQIIRKEDNKIISHNKLTINSNNNVLSQKVIIQQQLQNQNTNKLIPVRDNQLPYYNQQQSGHESLFHHYSTINSNNIKLSHNQYQNKQSLNSLKNLNTQKNNSIQTTSLQQHFKTNQQLQSKNYPITFNQQIPLYDNTNKHKPISIKLPQKINQLSSKPTLITKLQHTKISLTQSTYTPLIPLLDPSQQNILQNIEEKIKNSQKMFAQNKQINTEQIINKYPSQSLNTYTTTTKQHLSNYYNDKINN